MKERDAGNRRGAVLVVDDNADAGWGISKLLEGMGFETVMVHSGGEALDAMAERHPDAAIIDIDMPGLDGREVARRVRSAPWGRRMVLVAATGWSEESDEGAALASGFDAHMIKPVDMRKLAELLDTLLVAKRR